MKDKPALPGNTLNLKLKLLTKIVKNQQEMLDLLNEAVRLVYKKVDLLEDLVKELHK